jgi:hypothetical protein
MELICYLLVLLEEVSYSSDVDKPESNIAISGSPLFEWHVFLRGSESKHRKRHMLQQNLNMCSKYARKHVNRSNSHRDWGTHMTTHFDNE